jgi:hypothetical protein
MVVGRGSVHSAQGRPSPAAKDSWRHGVQVMACSPPVRSAAPGASQLTRAMPRVRWYPGSHMTSHSSPYASRPESSHEPTWPFVGAAMLVQQPMQSQNPST